MRLLQYLKKNSNLKGVLFSSIAMAFAGFGDALLYTVLPIYGEQMGFSVFWVGIFLSVNRFIRIPGNALIAFLIKRNGYKNSMLLATFFAMISTFFYGFKISIFLFLVLRIFWGLSYATMRVSSLAYASESVKNKNIMFGLVQSIKTTGAVLALFTGAYLITVYNVKTSFVFLGCMSAIGILFSHILPNIKHDSSKVSFNKIFHLSILNMLTFFTSFIIDGILVVTISKLLFGYTTTELVMLVSEYLLFRKLCSAVISIFSGWISDKFGVLVIFKTSLFFILSGFMFIINNYVEIGIIMAFFFNSAIVTLLPSVALKLNNENTLITLTSITTWWDIGTATGALFGLYLIELLGYQCLFEVLLCILFMVVLFFLKINVSRAIK